MNASRQLIKAAEWLNGSRRFSGCCAAMSAFEVCTCGPGVPFDDCEICKARDAFDLLAPEEAGDDGYWWPVGKNRDERVLALLFAAAIANSPHK